MNNRWQEIDPDTARMEVPGGWLYRWVTAGLAALAFVPDPQIKKRKPYMDKAVIR